MLKCWISLSRIHYLNSFFFFHFCHRTPLNKTQTSKKTVQLPTFHSDSRCSSMINPNRDALPFYLLCLAFRITVEFSSLCTADFQHAALSHQNNEYQEWINMSDYLISKWYDPVDLCMLKSKSTKYDECMSLRKHKDEFYCESTSQCQYSPLSLYQRPPGYDTDIPPDKNPKLIDMLLHMNKTGTSVCSI